MLRDKVVNALAWQTGAKLISQFFSFAVTIMLARLLLPSDFGLLGMAVVFTGFITLVNEMGIGSSIICKQEITNQELSSIFWFSLLVGGCLYALTFFAAPLVAWFFRNPEVTRVVRVLSVNLIIGSLRIVPYNLLSKEILFSQRSRAEIFSVVVGGTTALMLAYLGFGVWSLVANALVQGIVLAILCFWFSGWRPFFFLSFSMIRDMVSFGFKVMGSRMQWYFYSNADYFIVGRLLGRISLGYYTMAFNLAMMPTEKITAVINQVMFPVFAQLQDDTEQLRGAFLKTTRFVSLVTFPLMTLFAVLSPEIITGLLTDKWLPAIFPLRALCLVGLLKSIDVIIPQVLVARGKAALVLKYSTLVLCLLPLSFVIGGYLHGINGVACAWLIAYPPLVLCIIFWGLRELKLSLASYVRTLLPQSLGVFVMAAFLFAAKTIVIQAGCVSNIFIAISGCLTGLLFYGGYLNIFHGQMTREIMEEIKNLKGEKTISVGV